MKTLLARVRSWWRRLRQAEAMSAEMDEEMRFHLAMEAERLERERGLDAAEARRQAAIAFGGLEKYRAAGEDVRGVRWLAGLRLDLRVGGRMMLRHPALTVVGVIAVAFMIGVGAVGFEVARQVFWPRIPLPDGNAIVALRNWSVADSRTVSATRRDYELWREGLTTITDPGAMHVEERSVAVQGGAAQPATVASVTASIFALTRVPALMGRVLTEADERGDADDVVVIGYDFWKNRLASAEDVVGRVIRISGSPVTIIGVMPRGYGFPQSSEVWRPLHVERLPEATPSLSYVVGRLAPGRSREEANAEATAIGIRAATMFPETHENLRLQVRSLHEAVTHWPERATLILASINVFVVLLAALLCGNVGMLLFARAATREREILVRAALGAGRARLIVQLFAEALVLCAAGAVAGLVVARIVVERLWAVLEAQTGPLPFWIDTDLSTATIVYAAGLTLFAATVAGVVPALKVTRGGVGRRLRTVTSGGGGLQFGGVWTVIIVAQIALTTMLPVPLIGVGRDFTRETPAGFPAEAFLTATLEVDRLDGDAASGDTMPALRAARLEAGYRALEDRLRQEPGVVDVTYADQMPLARHRWNRIEMDAGPAARHDLPCASCAAAVSVDPRFLDVLGVPVLQGRTLTGSDAEHGTRAVLVNEFFVEHVLGGQNPLGRRVRPTSSSEPSAESWYEIVGVVPDFGVNDNASDYGRARIYHATSPRETGPLRLAIHMREDPQGFTQRLRELAYATDPALRVIDPQPMPRLAESGSTFWMMLLVGFTGVTVMLSLAGVYAVTAFAVARRTREIGVRVALGARPRHVLATVFKRPFMQVGLGIGVGAVLGLGIANNDLSDVQLDDFGMAAVYALLTVLCCALACIVPTRRALRIQPTQALKDDS